MPGQEQPEAMHAMQCRMSLGAQERPEEHLGRQLGHAKFCVDLPFLRGAVPRQHTYSRIAAHADGNKHLDHSWSNFACLPVRLSCMATYAFTFFVYWALGQQIPLQCCMC